MVSNGRKILELDFFRQKIIPKNSNLKIKILMFRFSDFEIFQDEKIMIFSSEIFSSSKNFGEIVLHDKEIFFIRVFSE